MQWAWELCGAVLRLSRGTASGRLAAYTFAKGLPQAEAHSGLRLAAVVQCGRLCWNID